MMSVNPRFIPPAKPHRRPVDRSAHAAGDCARSDRAEVEPDYCDPLEDRRTGDRRPEGCPATHRAADEHAQDDVAGVTAGAGGGDPADQTMIEPVFAQHKAVRGFDQFACRGERMCATEWKLMNTTHNLLKLWR
jgi:Transposase DDE domain